MCWMTRGSSGAGAGEGSGTVSAPSSSARMRGGEEALGGLSLREARRLSDEEWEVATAVVLLLLKTGPSTESSSSLDGMSTTPLFFSRGAGEGEALSVARGIAAIGVGESRAGAVCG